MLTMQGLTLLKNVELSAMKMDCGSLPIHPTHLISHIRLLSVRLCQGTSQRNGVPSYEELLDAIGEVVTGLESETLTTVFEQ
jgi:hypothetical protein